MVTTENEELIVRFIVHLRTERGSSEKTISDYRRDLDSLARQVGRPLDQAQRSDIQTYLSTMITEGKTGRTAARHLSSFRMFFRFLMDIDQIVEDPTRNLPGPKSWKKVPKAIGQADLEKLVAALDDSALGIRDRAILLLFYGSGLRESELAALKVEDVDLDAGIVKIWNGKGGKDARVPLSELSIEAIRHYLREARPWLAKFGFGGGELSLNPSRTTIWRRKQFTKNKSDSEPSAYLFLGRRCGTRMTRQQIYYLVRDISRSVLGESFSPKSLRHGYATALIDGGADVRDVQVLMRHSDIGTTEIYIHTDINYLRRFHAKHPRASIAASDQAVARVSECSKQQPEHDPRVHSRSRNVG
jgi:integrase/recombinase XerD